PPLTGSALMPTLLTSMERDTAITSILAPFARGARYPPYVPHWGVMRLDAASHASRSVPASSRAATGGELGRLFRSPVTITGAHSRAAHCRICFAARTLDRLENGSRWVLNAV